MTREYPIDASDARSQEKRVIRTQHPELERLWTLAEIGKRWRTSPATVRRAIERGLLHALNLSLGGQRASWRVRMADLLAYENTLSTSTPGAADLSSAVPRRVTDVGVR